MSSRRQRVLVVDDSALERAVVCELLAQWPDVEVVGDAADGAEALRMVAALDPDVVTLDVEMPAMDGLQTLRAMMTDSPRAVVMLSGATTRGGEDLTIRALELGALEFVRKPTTHDAAGWRGVAPRLEAALRAARNANLRLPMLDPARRDADRAAAAPVPARRAVVLAASTGGPRALAEIVPALTAHADVALLIVQHMPSGFTAGLARRLDALAAFPVREAQHDEPLLGAHAYVAPGGRQFTVAVVAGRLRAAVTDAPAVHNVRPAADPLLVSVARACGASAIGVVLTGMGRDGAAGLAALRAAGGRAIVQDAATSAIDGMPAQARAAVPDARVAGVAELAALIDAALSAGGPTNFPSDGAPRGAKNHGGGAGG